MNSSSSCRQVGEGLFIHNSQKLAVTAQMSGTSGESPELPENLRNFRKNSGTSGTSGPDSSNTLKGFAKTFWCARKASRTSHRIQKVNLSTLEPSKDKR